MTAERDLASSTTVRAGRTVARLSRVIERCCTDVGLNLAQYRLLVFVERAPQRAGALARQDSVSGPSLTARIDALAARGLLRRETVPGDRRGVELALTDEGREVLGRIEAAIEKRLGSIFADPSGRALLEALAGAQLPSGKGPGPEPNSRSTP